MSELAVPTEAALFLNVSTGELLPATLENAAIVLEVARDIEAKLRAVKQAATAFLVEEAMRQGKKTFHTSRGKVEITGGNVVEYDAAELIDALVKAGCPWERVSECVEETISYKVNRSVLRQLAGANPDYKAAAESAQRVVNKPIRASVK